MKHWLAVLVLCSFSLHADSWLTDATQATEHFLVLRSSDHQTAYFVPRAYGVDRGQSSILPSAAGDDPVIRINVLLQPVVSDPQGTERQEISSWAQTTGLAPYPSMFVSLSDQYTFPPAGIQILRISDRGHGRKLIQIDIRPRLISLMSALKILANFQPNQRLHVYNEEVGANATLSADFAAAATFVENHYTEKTCTISRECSGFLFWSKCQEEEWCVGIPRVLQQLQSASFQTAIQLSVQKRSDVSENILNKLQEQLLSRLMLKLFVHNSESHLDDTLQIILGDLNRSASGHYFDSLSQTEITDKTFEEPVTIADLKGFLTPELTRIYKSLRGEL